MTEQEKMKKGYLWGDDEENMALQACAKSLVNQFNSLPPEAMEDMYYSESYREMESFPGADSIRIMDGVMYIKTENRE